MISATLETITAALKEGDKVQLVGFAAFEVKKRAAASAATPRPRVHRNPRLRGAVFKAGKALKDSVSK